VRSEPLLYALRACNGLASATTFVAGGLLAARLASHLAPASKGLRSGHVLGLYYGGTGLGVIAATLAVPPLPWPVAWAALGALALCATAVTALYTPHLSAPPLPGAAHQALGWRPLAWALAGYLMFGLGYIG
jgi:MFS family permease